jgi:hypothetical protein
MQHGYWKLCEEVGFPTVLVPDYFYDLGFTIETGK